MPDDTAPKFIWPLPSLENARLRLVPFDAELHGPAFVDGVKDRPELFDYIPATLATMSDVRHFCGKVISRWNGEAIPLAILVKSGTSRKEEILAGMVGYLDASERNLSVEIGFVDLTLLILISAEQYRSLCCRSSTARSLQRMLAVC